MTPVTHILYTVFVPRQDMRVEPGNIFRNISPHMHACERVYVRTHACTHMNEHTHTHTHTQNTFLRYDRFSYNQISYKISYDTNLLLCNLHANWDFKSVLKCAQMSTKGYYGKPKKIGLCHKFMRLCHQTDMTTYPAMLR